MAASADKPRKRARSAITGRFVSFAYALKHRTTTVIESVRRKSK